MKEIKMSPEGYNSIIPEAEFEQVIKISKEVEKLIEIHKELGPKDLDTNSEAMEYQMAQVLIFLKNLKELGEVSQRIIQIHDLGKKDFQDIVNEHKEMRSIRDLNKMLMLDQLL